MRQSGSSQPSLGSFVVAVVVTPNCRSRFWSAKHSLLVAGSIPRLSRGRRRSLAATDEYTPILTAEKRRPDAPKTARAALIMLRSVVRSHLAPQKDVVKGHFWNL